MKTKEAAHSYAMLCSAMFDECSGHLVGEVEAGKA